MGSDPIRRHRRALEVHAASSRAERDVKAVIDHNPGSGSGRGLHGPTNEGFERPVTKITFSDLNEIDPRSSRGGDQGQQPTGVTVAAPQAFPVRHQTQNRPLGLGDVQHRSPVEAAGSGVVIELSAADSRAGGRVGKHRVVVTDFGPGEDSHDRGRHIEQRHTDAQHSDPGHTTSDDVAGQKRLEGRQGFDEEVAFPERRPRGDDQNQTNFDKVHNQQDAGESCDLAPPTMSPHRIKQ